MWLNQPVLILGIFFTFGVSSIFLGSLFSVFWLKVGDECITAMGTVTLLLFTMVGNGLHMGGDVFCLKVLANVEPLPLG